MYSVSVFTLRHVADTLYRAQTGTSVYSLVFAPSCDQVPEHEHPRDGLTKRQFHRGTKALCPHQMAMGNDLVACGSGGENDTAQTQGGVGSKRAKAKKFLKKNGPRVAGASVTIGMLVLNVVSYCS